MANKKISSIIVTLFVIMLIFVSGCTNSIPNNNNSNKTNNTSNNQNQNKNVNFGSQDITINSSNELKKFNSAEELKAFLEANTQNSQTSTNSRDFGATDGDMVMEASAMTKSVASDSAPSSAGSGASDYSQTNIQVAGVDEADFVKNDNKYIYILSNNKLVIVDAYPAEDAEILSETKFEGTPQQMLLSENKIIVFSSDYEEKVMVSDYDFLPRPRYTSVMKVTIFDIKDKENPEIIEEYKTDGNYYDARMVGDFVYFISQESVYYYNGLIGVPEIWSGNTKIASPEIYYFDNSDDNYVFHTIGAIDLSKDELDLEAKTFMLGWGSTLYVSQDNIYIAYQKGYPYYWYRNSNLDMFENVVLELLPTEVQNKIKSLDKSDEREYRSQIKNILDEMYSSMDEKDVNKLVEKIEDAVSDYEAKIAQERDKTIVHRISIDGYNIEHESQAEIKGHLLNQFSLDENDENLRVATTVSYWTRDDGRIQYNNVYVLDKDMETIGKLENIAKDESIYSTRFMGDKLYMVTFKQIDPFFVIDLSNPQKPEVLGELKIPGFSTYLHPYDENHIIGFGQATGENEYGSTITKGLKISLFDVTDFNNPKEVDTFEIGLQGTTSQALNEHKAFLFDYDKNLMVIPVHEVVSEEKYDSRYGYKRETWQGAYVFDVTENGFELKGKVEHNYDNEGNYYWYSPYNVKRSLFMDNTLYTISESKIIMSDLDNIKKINSISLPQEKQEIYPTPYYINDIAIE